MNKENIKDSMSSINFPQQLSLNQEKMNKKDIYDEELISLINGLNESIKEYYKVSSLSTNEISNFVSAYEKQKQSIDYLINDIIHSKQYQRLNGLFNFLNKINEIINKVQINVKSGENNLNLFFEDAKMLFKKMKMNRKQKLSETISNHNQIFKDSLGLADNNTKVRNIQSPININDNNNIVSNPLITIKRIYTKIITLLNKFSEFNLIINQTNVGKSNEYINLQNNIKKELDFLWKMIKVNFVKNNMNNINANIYSNNNFNITNNEKNDKRSHSQSRGQNERMQRLEKMNLIYERKLKELTNQLNSYRNSNMRGSGAGTPDGDTKRNEIDININTLNLKIKKLEQMLKEKDNIIMSFNNNLKSELLSNNKNLNQNLSNIIKIKENQIMNLQEELNVYQNNENIFNSEILDLNNKIESKINQYENQISVLNNKNAFLSRTLMDKNKEIVKLQNEIKDLNMKLKNVGKTNIKIQNIEDISEYNKAIEEFKNTINQLNKELLIYKKKDKINEETNNKYIEQIEELNNNILSINRIIEQKDELIKQLNEKIYTPDGNNRQNVQNYNNEIKILKIENEKLKKQIEASKKVNNNTNNNNKNTVKDNMMNNEIKELKELNIQLMEENNELRAENEELGEKIKKLSLENQKIQESVSSQKGIITKLETDINKKNEELEGLKTFIFKLQTKLENKENNSGVNHSKSFSNMDQNSKSNIASKKSLNDNKSVEEGKDKDLKTKNILNKLNEAEKTIAGLQKKVRDLQFKLEEKQVEKELSGYRTEDNNYSNFEEEFDLRKMINGAKDKNRSEDINIDYPGIVGIKDKNRQLMQNMKMLEEQIKLLILNINCNNKIKPQVTQICQLLRIPAKNIPLIISGKDKKRALGIID